MMPNRDPVPGRTKLMDGRRSPPKDRELTCALA